MQHNELSWSGIDNKKLYGQAWIPDKVEAVVCLVHGMGEHSGRYKHVAQFFNDRNWAVMTIDQRGHGKSEGARGHVQSFEVLLNQVDQLLKSAEEKYPNLPKFTYGHSMGGNVIINHTLRHKPKVKGVVATGPWLKLAFDPPKIKLSVGKLMRKIYPAYTEGNGLDANDLSHDKQVVQAYIDDPLVHDKVSTGFFFAVHEAGEWAIDNAAKLDIPLLVCHGSDDKITSFEASKNFAAKAGSKATFKGWEGMYHEIHNELDNADVLESIYDWMKQQL